MYTITAKSAQMRVVKRTRLARRVCDVASNALDELNSAYDPSRRLLEVRASHQRLLIGSPASLALEETLRKRGDIFVQQVLTPHPLLSYFRGAQRKLEVNSS